MNVATAAPVQAWDKPAIQALLQSNDRAVHRALLQLYRRQTAGERSSFSTQVSNDQGFTASDAPTLTRLAKQVERGLALGPADLQLARDRLMKYTRQLQEIILDRQLTQLTRSA